MALTYSLTPSLLTYSLNLDYTIFSYLPWLVLFLSKGAQSYFDEGGQEIKGVHLIENLGTSLSKTRPF